MCQNCYVKVDWKFKIKNSLGEKEPIENFSNGFLFLQGTHSTVNDEFKWKDDFKGEVFYSHSKSDSCGVSICFIFSKRLFIRNKLSDNDGCILILNVDIDDENFILICITPAPKLSS